MKIPGEEIINYLLLKTRTRKTSKAKIIQNHGFINRPLKGSYGSLPNIPSSRFSNHEYGLSKYDRSLSFVKKFLINPIVYKF